MTQYEVVDEVADQREAGRRLVGTGHIARATGIAQEDVAVVTLRAWRAGRLGRCSARSGAGRHCYGYWVTEKGYRWLDWQAGRSAMEDGAMQMSFEWHDEHTDGDVHANTMEDKAMQMNFEWYDEQAVHSVRDGQGPGNTPKDETSIDDGQMDRQDAGSRAAALGDAAGQDEERWEDQWDAKEDGGINGDDDGSEHDAGDEDDEDAEDDHSDEYGDDADDENEDHDEYDEYGDGEDADDEDDDHDEYGDGEDADADADDEDDEDDDDGDEAGWG